MDNVLVSINNKTQIVTIFYNGTKLIKSINDFVGLNEEDIKKKFISELNKN